MTISPDRHNGMVHRSVTLALAAVVTSFIFTSVAVVFTAGADSSTAIAGQVAASGGAAVQFVSQPGA